MDNFTKGMHYVYDAANNSFVPAPSSPVDPSSNTMKEIDASSFVSNDQDTSEGQYSSPKDPSDEPRRSRHPDRIPRPRNAFMIFRSEFSTGAKIKRDVEHDNRQISRIAGHCWNQMSEADKEPWRLKAEQEKLEHMRKYPDYRFTPLVREKRPLKRNTKRNGEDDKERCRRVADLLLSGKEGDELAIAINSPTTEDEGFPNPSGSPPTPEANYIPPFRSPLLLPTQATHHPLSALNTPTGQSLHYNAYYHAQQHTTVFPSHYASVKTESAFAYSSRPPYPETPHYARSPYSLSPAEYSHSPTAYPPSSQYAPNLPVPPQPPRYPESPTYYQSASYPASPTGTSPTTYYNSQSVQMASSSTVNVSQPYTLQSTPNVTDDQRSSHIVFSNPFEPQQHTPRPRPRLNLAISPLDPLHLDLPMYYSNY
ncbi:unnamed protein product [Cyclocybe aegerita]|uniref:HMG box domain-containing protein n=1 Tax=Cyclocybe aegerita TaxID=1973307 RepID=A0A8S0XLZ8_CYCAE|nr:unnamed protein product [Cyclocybe aegerita]